MPRYQNPADVNFYQGAATGSGKLYFYESGTSTPKATYADSSESVLNSHPVLLDSSGREPNIFYSGSAKVVFENSAGDQVWERDPVGGESTLGNFSDFSLEIIYGLDDIVKSNSKFYISITASNQGNDPATSGEEWSEIRFLGVYNEFQSYDIGEIIQTSDGDLWTSLVNNNLGNTPATDDGTNWLLTNTPIEGITKTAISHFLCSPRTIPMGPRRVADLSRIASMRSKHWISIRKKGRRFLGPTPQRF